MKKPLMTTFLLLLTVMCWAQSRLIDDFIQEGKASRELRSSGMYAAHNSLPIGSRPMVKNNANGKEIEVTIIGRIPNSQGRVIDITQDVARAIEIESEGTITLYFKKPPVVEVTPSVAEPMPQLPAVPVPPEPASFPVAPVAQQPALSPEPKVIVVLPKEPKPAPPEPPVAKPSLPQSPQPEVIAVLPEEPKPAPPEPPVAKPAISEPETVAKPKQPINIIINIPPVQLPAEPAVREQPVPPPAPQVVQQPPVAQPPAEPAVREQPLPPPAPQVVHQPPVVPIIQQPTPPPVSNVRVIPGLPDPNSGKYYNLQVGSFSSAASAAFAFRQVQNAGFEVIQEQVGSFYRVSAVRVLARDIFYAAQRLGVMGFSEVWIRE